MSVEKSAIKTSLPLSMLQEESKKGNEKKENEKGKKKTTGEETSPKNDSETRKEQKMGSLLYNPKLLLCNKNKAPKVLNDNINFLYEFTYINNSRTSDSANTGTVFELLTEDFSSSPRYIRYATWCGWVNLLCKYWKLPKSVFEKDLTEETVIYLEKAETAQVVEVDNVKYNKSYQVIKEKQEETNEKWIKLINERQEETKKFTNNHNYIKLIEKIYFNAYFTNGEMHSTLKPLNPKLFSFKDMQNYMKAVEMILRLQGLNAETFDEKTKKLIKNIFSNTDIMLAMLRCQCDGIENIKIEKTRNKKPNHGLNKKGKVQKK